MSEFGTQTVCVCPTSTVDNGFVPAHEPPPCLSVDESDEQPWITAGRTGTSTSNVPPRTSNWRRFSMTSRGALAAQVAPTSHASPSAGAKAVPDRQAPCPAGARSGRGARQYRAVTGSGCRAPRHLGAGEAQRARPSRERRPRQAGRSGDDTAARSARKATQRGIAASRTSSSSP